MSDKTQIDDHLSSLKLPQKVTVQRNYYIKCVFFRYIRPQRKNHTRSEVHNLSCFCRQENVMSIQRKRSTVLEGP